jgi:regulator of protease activity HflC (stomatin/prohibitin superfamily)
MSNSVQEARLIRNFVIVSASVILSLVIINAAIGPIYNVWAKSLAGKAQLAEAESNRQIAVLEAKAKYESAKELALAEVERAKGVAAANQIIGDSLKGNREYLQYLYITGLETAAEKGAKTIYIPTEGGMPVPTLSVDK